VVGFCFERPAEGNGMAFRHIRAHDHDRIGIDEVTRKGSRPATAE
jgi:hypothetical protein